MNGPNVFCFCVVIIVVIVVVLLLSSIYLPQDFFLTEILTHSHKKIKCQNHTIAKSSLVGHGGWEIGKPSFAPVAHKHSGK